MGMHRPSLAAQRNEPIYTPDSEGRLQPVQMLTQHRRWPRTPVPHRLGEHESEQAALLVEGCGWSMRFANSGTRRAELVAVGCDGAGPLLVAAGPGIGPRQR